MPARDFEYVGFSAEQLPALLSELDAELASENLDTPCRIVIAGGAAIALRVPSRVTGDVDVVSEGMPAAVRRAAERVASRHGLRPDWINDAAKLKTVAVAADPEPVFEGARLVVESVGPRYLLAEVAEDVVDPHTYVSVLAVSVTDGADGHVEQTTDGTDTVLEGTVVDVAGEFGEVLADSRLEVDGVVDRLARGVSTGDDGGRDPEHEHMQGRIFVERDRAGRCSGHGVLLRRWFLVVSFPPNRGGLV